MGPGSLLAGSQAEAQTYLSPAGRQRPQPQAPGAQKGMCLLGLQEQVSKQDRTAWPQGSPQSQGKAGPKGAGLDQLGLRGRKGPESKRDASLCSRVCLHMRGRETAVCQANSLMGSQDSGLDPSSIHKHSELGATVSSVTSDLAALLALPEPHDVLL